MTVDPGFTPSPFFGRVKMSRTLCWGDVVPEDRTSLPESSISFRDIMLGQWCSRGQGLSSWRLYLLQGHYVEGMLFPRTGSIFLKALSPSRTLCWGDVVLEWICCTEGSISFNFKMYDFLHKLVEKQFWVCTPPMQQ